MKILQITSASIHPDFGYGDALTNSVFGLGDDGKVYEWDFGAAEWSLAKLPTNN